MFRVRTLGTGETPEITGRILAYCAGDMSFAQLRDRLSHHRYTTPKQRNGRVDIFATGGESSSFEGGTLDELYYAKALGLLTAAELEAILSAAQRAHGA